MRNYNKTNLNRPGYRNQKAFLYALLFISVVLLFSQYFHTETTLTPQDNCPICVWERSVYTTGQIYLFCLAISIVLYRRLFASQEKNLFSEAYGFFNSRAPPAL
ncbi:MAG: hypothetical protein GY757_33215 [bacterium]|nr:hypothetical protein [bacterium]